MRNLDRNSIFRCRGGRGLVHRRGCRVYRRRRLICLPGRAVSTTGTAEFHIRCHGRSASRTDECRRPVYLVRWWCLIYRFRHRRCHGCRSRGSSSGRYNFPALCPTYPAELLIGCEQCTAGKTAKVRGRGGRRGSDSGGFFDERRPAGAAELLRDADIFTAFRAERHRIIT